VVYEQVFAFYGSQSAIAAALGVSVQAVSNWKRRKFIPLGSQARLQILTNGQLIAEQGQQMTQGSIPAKDAGKGTKNERLHTCFPGSV
jgi:hypothetical protein